MADKATLSQCHVKFVKSVSGNYFRMIANSLITKLGRISSVVWGLQYRPCRRDVTSR